jgi:hypothetical protein
MRVYISGQITGLELQEAQERFEGAETLLENIGLNPINPLKNGLPFNTSWEEHLVKDIELLMGCNAIMLLGNWKNSKGARIEKFVAEELGLVVLHEDILNEMQLVDRLKEAITEVTGIPYEQYTKVSRSREWFYCRLIFTHHCLLKDRMTPDEVAGLINRSNQDARRYRGMYYQEYNYNKAFRVWAKGVEDRLSKACNTFTKTLQHESE